MAFLNTVSGKIFILKKQFLDKEDAERRRIISAFRNEFRSVVSLGAIK